MKICKLLLMHWSMPFIALVQRHHALAQMQEDKSVSISLWCVLSPSMLLFYLGQETCSPDRLTKQLINQITDQHSNRPSAPLTDLLTRCYFRMRSGILRFLCVCGSIYLSIYLLWVLTESQFSSSFTMTLYKSALNAA